MAEKEIVFKVDKVVETKNEGLEKDDRVVTTLIPANATATKLKLTITEIADDASGSMIDDIGANLGVGDEIKILFKGHLKQALL